MITSSPQNEKLSNYNLPVFKSKLTNGKEIRVLGTYDKPLFIAKDIAEILGYKDTKDAVKKHVDEEDKISYSKLSINERGGISPPLKIQPQTQLINESGLYSLILRSKLPSSKEFKRWVTSEVLPSIRKTGEYKIQEFQEKLKNAENLIQEKEKEIKKVSENHQKLLKRRKREKHDSGNVVYLISSDAIDTYHKSRV